VDVSDMMTSLRRRPGLTEWKVIDFSGDEIRSLADVEGMYKSRKGKEKFLSTMFPYGNEKENAMERW
jgi:hypothetical protein